jgi:glycosyltransferase involved in cell wall biosynthesis
MSVSVVMPVYNEEGVIEKIIRQCYAEIVAKIDGAELIVVNDGSVDSTPLILGRLAEELSQLTVVNIEKNNGYSNALRAGFSQVKNQLIFHVDGDGQFEMADFWKLYAAADNSDIVLGCRIPRRDPLYRRVVSLLARLVNKIIFKVSVKDVNSPFKLIRTRVLEDVIGYIHANPFAISVLIVLAAKWRGYRITEIPVTHLARVTGKSMFSNIGYLFKGCFLCFREILWLRKQTLCKKSIAGNGNAKQNMLLKNAISMLKFFIMGIG